MPRLEVKLRSTQEVIASAEVEGETVEHLRHYLNLLTETPLAEATILKILATDGTTYFIHPDDISFLRLVE
jgi:hypothetical protein